MEPRVTLDQQYFWAKYVSSLGRNLTVVPFRNLRLAVLIEHSVVALVTSVPGIHERVFVNALGCILFAAVNMVAIITHAFRVMFSSSMLTVGDYFGLATSSGHCGYRLGHHLSWSHHLVFLLSSTILILFFMVQIVTLIIGFVKTKLYDLVRHNLILTLFWALSNWFFFERYLHICTCSLRGTDGGLHLHPIFSLADPSQNYIAENVCLDRFRVLPEIKRWKKIAICI